MRRSPYYPSFFNTTTEPAIRLAGKLAQLAPDAARAHDLQQLRLGGERDGAEADPRLSEAARQAAQDEDPHAQVRLPRRDPRDDEHDRAAELHRAVRSAAAGLHPRARAVRLRRRQRERSRRSTASGASRKPSASSCARIRRRSRAMFAEPMQGAGGVIVPPPGLSARRCASSAAEHDILFVADEVITGFGRLGDWFASDAVGARSRPDDRSRRASPAATCRSARRW